MNPMVFRRRTPSRLAAAVLFRALQRGAAEALVAGSLLWWWPASAIGGVVPTQPSLRAATHPAVVLESGGSDATGEPITLSLKDADLKDVIKTFATLTGLNIVVDPAVSGTVTVELRDVPWDQAFELILTINGLGHEVLGNVVYIAPRSKLATHPLYRRGR